MPRIVQIILDKTPEVARIIGLDEDGHLWVFRWAGHNWGKWTKVIMEDDSV